MKQLVVFDIENCQKDYSEVMECINFLKNKKLTEAGILIKGSLEGKFSRIALNTENAVPRYFECPQIKQTDTIKGTIINHRSDIYHRYYNFMSSYSLKDNLSDEKGIQVKSLQLCLPDGQNKYLAIQVPDVILSKINTRENISRSQWAQSVDDNEIYYHIRVRVKNDSVFYLQYLALLLQNHQDLIDTKKISVLLLKDDVCLHYFPFTNIEDKTAIKSVNEEHKFFSRYLRLLAKDNTGVIFAPYCENKIDDNEYEVKISPLNFKDASKGDKFFPIMEIKSDEYFLLFENNNDNWGKELSSEIREKDLFNDNLTSSSKYSLFQTGNLRFYNADAKNPYDALLAFVAETAWKRLQKNWIFEDNTFDSDIFSNFREIIVKRFSEEKNNWLTFAIFSFIFNAKNNYPQKKKSVASYVNESYQLARELSTGLQQLIQNSIQHSENNSCFLTFFLDSNEKNLHISVVDVNTQKTILESFKERLQKEIDTCNKMNLSQENTLFDYSLLTNNHESLINEENISLKHLFNIFDDMDDNKNLTKENKRVCELWKNFRCSDSTAHVGLLIFYQAIIHCNADFMIQSSKKFEIENESKCRFIDIAEDRENKYVVSNKDRFPKEASSRIIPGTQYQITVPLYNTFNNPVGEASISNINDFSENYTAFAKYIDFTSKDFTPFGVDNLIEKTQSKHITKPDEKFIVQLFWTKFWYNQFTTLKNNSIKNTVFHWRVDEKTSEYFSQNDKIEVFLKGLFGALISNLNLSAPLFVAITNLNPNFLEVLRTVCISLSGKNFCENLQIYFVDSSCEKSIQLFGNSFYDAVMNAVKLSIEHGSNLFRSYDTLSVNHIASASKTNVQCSAKPISVMPFDVIVPEFINKKRTIFDARMLNLVEKRFDGADSHGYKLEHTHMRLGNKVHIQSFYEMSFLFYRTTIANRIAFKILRSYSSKLLGRIETASHMYSVKPILFYSYASYSKAILTSLVEIARDYIELHIRNRICKEDLKIEESEINKIISVARSQIAFASYQHNLQSETNNDHIQLYFGLQKEFSGAKLANSKEKGGLCLKLKNFDDIAVVLVVPISSTLTTFDKMFSKLKERVHEDSDDILDLLKISDSYTAFWVRDKNEQSEGNTTKTGWQSNIEKDYWIKLDESEQIITVKTSSEKFTEVGLTELERYPYIHYFMKVEAFWNPPLLCPLCFPFEKELIREVPLVETDLTSTVPTQQIRCEKPIELNSQKIIRMKKRSEFNLGDESYSNSGNNYRLKLLKDCVYYGHIKRSKNHHQYYISTQDYFYKNEVQFEIRNWLKNLQEKDKSNSPKLKIIFSPEHNTNVGFAQYVNTYYFNGSAEIISVNEDKVFRSNFICEHEMLRNTIERLHIQKNIFDDNYPVEFYFVDDSIITGATVNKANSLLRSLIPEKYALEYPSFLFKKCFILIDRLSQASKRSYVMSGDENDFYSFVHIDISNMRTQGDSCVGCKLQNEAKKMFKRSASRITSSYWANKYNRLEPVNYDDFDEMETLKSNLHAYERLILSHISQNFIFSDGISTREKGEYYDCILFLFETILGYPQKKGLKKKNKEGFFFYDLLEDIFQNFYSDKSKNYTKEHLRKDPKICIAELLLKLLSRPFFSFDYSFRVQIQSFVLILAECYLDYNSKNNMFLENENTLNWDKYIHKLQSSIPLHDCHKGFLLHNQRIERTIKIAQLFLKLHNNNKIWISSFLKEVVFEALADMRSTYLIRKEVLIKVGDFVESQLEPLSKHINGNESCNCWECSVCSTNNCKCNYLLDATQCKNKSASMCFWISYLANVQRVLECGSDEIKSVWFEYLLLSGEEITNKTQNKIYTFNVLNQDKQIEIKNLLSTKNDLIASEVFLTTASTGFDIIEKKLSQKSETEHFLRNYYLSKSWINQDVRTCEKISEWHKLLPSLNTGCQESKTTVPQIDERYKDFLENMVNYVAEINKLDCNIFNVALLTMSNKESRASIDKIQLVKDWFGNDTATNIDIKQARYIIKDRVVSAFNNEDIEHDDNAKFSVGKLRECGYQLFFASPDISTEKYVEQQNTIEYFNHHVAKDHRKPYIIIYFDNPDNTVLKNDLGRKIVPLSRVFLYISMNIKDGSKRDKLPWIILRDVLTYRNRILRFLAEDFNGDIMEKHAASVKEEAILTHERSSSHASTTDEKGVLRVFGIGDVSKLNELTYPIDLNTKKIIDGYNRSNNNYYSAELWLLLQNYVNCQIARLFSRHFNRSEDAKVESAGIPALYLSLKNEQKDDVLKNRLVDFSDLNVAFDNRFLLLNKAANINFCISEKCRFYSNYENKYYNVEYMRCILLDIFFSSIKYATIDDSLLPRIDNLIHNRNCIPEFKKKLESHIICFKDRSDLVILNNVKRTRVKSTNIKSHNEEIYRRTHDPLDYGDGHMSLLTIRSFILGIYEGSHLPCKKDTIFQYITKEDAKNLIERKPFFDKFKKAINDYEIWFETRLPIFLEEDSNEPESNNLD